MTTKMNASVRAYTDSTIIFNDDSSYIHYRIIKILYSIKGPIDISNHNQTLGAESRDDSLHMVYLRYHFFDNAHNINLIPYIKSVLSLYMCIIVYHDSTKDLRSNIKIVSGD